MAHMVQDAPPVVRAGAGFNNHFGGRQFAEEGLHLSMPDLATRHWVFILVDR
jgi:hypothetical protein